MAGTVVLSSLRAEGKVRRARITATGDGATGSIPATTLSSLGIFIDGTILAVITNPGATGPTDNWDLTLLDADGVDRLGGACADRDTSTSEYASIGRPAAIDEALTLTFENNSVASAVIEVVILWAQGATSTGSASSSSSAAGTEYTEGGTDSSITGTAIMWEDSSDTLRAVSAAKPLPATHIPSATPTITTQADQATNATLLSADATRRSWVILNDSDQLLYLKCGATATATDHTWQVPPGATIFCDFYNGRVDGIWAADSSGSARITSFAL